MAVTARAVKNKRDSEGRLTGRAGTVYDVNVKYKLPDGTKKAYIKKGFLTKLSAQQHEAKMKTELQNPDYFIETAKPEYTATVKEYFDSWLDNHAKTNLRPSTYSSYTNLTRHYIMPYLGNIKLRDLSPVTLDKLFQRFLDEGLKPGTVLIVKRLLSVALEHARKYRYVDINAAKDTLTKLSPTKDTAPPFDIEQTKVLLESVSNTVWEMPVMLGGLYGLRRSEIVGLRWQNVDLDNNTFMVVEQLPFKLPKGTTTIDEMAPTKSKASMRMLPITDLARPFFEKQLEIQNCQKQFAEQHNLEYYDNGLLIAKQDGTPLLADWISTQFPALLSVLDMPHIRFHDLRHVAATNMHQLTGDFFTVGEILGHTGIAASLGMSVNFEMVTSRYVDVRMERKKQVIDIYHNAINEQQAEPIKPTGKKKIPEPKKAKYMGFEL